MVIYFSFLIIPMVIAFVAKKYFNADITWLEMIFQIVASFVIIAALIAGAKYYNMSDFHYLNGEVLKKNRDHGFYIETYSCNCRTVSNGNSSTTTCDTCTRNHYTVDWWLDTTVGRINIDSVDSTFSSVYDEPDPNAYKKAYIGEPCSVSKMYLNYVKAAPNSLFHKHKYDDSYTAIIPDYPTIYGIYHVNRVRIAGKINGKIDTSMWDKLLSEKLKKLGPKKQVNIVIVVTSAASQDFRYALEDAWLGGKKNDVIVILGVPDYPEIAWTDTITFGGNIGNELMTVEMRDTIMDIGTIEDPAKIVNSIGKVVDERFDRIPMEKFEYLLSEVELSTGMIIFGIIMSILVSVGLTYVNWRYDVFNRFLDTKNRGWRR